MKPKTIENTKKFDTKYKKAHVATEIPKIEFKKENKELLDNKLFVQNKFCSDQCLDNLISEKKIKFVFSKTNYLNLFL